MIPQLDPRCVQPVPVETVTGCLGSGKTTLLQRLLIAPEFADVAVLINEFGEISLDHEIVRPIDEKTVVLKSGCICCGVRDDLASSLRDLLSLRDTGAVRPFSRIVVETTGVAEPAPILATLSFEPVLRHQVRPGCVVTVIDGLHARLHEGTRPEWTRQVVAADVLVLTKSDLAGPREVESVWARLEELNPTATIVDAGAAGLEEAILTAEAGGRESSTLHENWQARSKGGADSGKGSDGRGPASAAGHDHGVKALCLEASEPLDWAAFGVWLSMLVHAHGERILRIKGILMVKGAEDRLVVHGVQHVIHAPVHLSAPEDEPDEEGKATSRIIIISDGIPQQRLRRSFEAFVVNA